MTNTGAIIATIKLRRERNLVRLMRERGAYSAVNAIAIDRQVGLAGGALRGLLKRGAVIESKPGHYWLNEAAYKAMRSKRTTLMCVLIVAAIAGVAIAMAMVR